MAKTVQAPVNVESLTAEQRGVLMAALRETSGALGRAEGERTYVSETKKKLAKDLGLAPKLISKLVKVYHKQSFEQEKADAEEFERLYLKVTVK